MPSVDITCTDAARGTHTEDADAGAPSRELGNGVRPGVAAQPEVLREVIHDVLSDS